MRFLADRHTSRHVEGSHVGSPCGVSCRDLVDPDLHPCTPRHASEHHRFPQPTITVEVIDADVAANRVPTDPINQACHHIPFLLRPIASGPITAKVILSYQHVARGEMVVGCHDGNQISSKQY